jgi:hypothetical protein
MCLTYYSVFYACAHAWIDPDMLVELCEIHKLHLQQNLPERVCPNARYWQKHKIHGKCPECCGCDVGREKEERGERAGGRREEGNRG